MRIALCLSGIVGKLYTKKAGYEWNGDVDFRIGTCCNNLRAVIDSSGNVGIGTASPDSILHAWRDAAEYTATITQNQGNGHCLDVLASASDDNTQIHSRFRTDAGPLLTIQNNGKVGIGTTSPALLLEVSQSVNSDFAGAVRNFSSTGWGFQVQGGGDSGDYALHCKNHNDTQVLFTVRGDGCITAPALPAFNAHPAGVTSNITRNTNVAIILGTERFDQNADFQQSTGDGQGGDGSNLRGQFTAPITGKYQLNYNLLLNNIPTDTAYIEYGIITSNFSYYLDWNFGHDEAPEYGWDGHVSIVADMDASDTAYCFVHQAGGTDTTTDIGVKTNFSGFMVA